MSMPSPSAKMPRRALCSDSPLDKKTTNDSSEDNKSANLQCELNYDVLTIIFKKLNARDLRNAARVCRVAEIEKRIRTELPLTLAITFDDVKDSWTNLHTGEKFIDLLRMKPMVGPTFANTCTPYDLEMKENKADCPCESLPLGCLNITIGNHEVVMDQLSWTKDDNQNIQKVASIFLPEAQDVTVKTIYLMEEYDDREPWNVREQFPTIEDKVECIDGQEDRL